MKRYKSKHGKSKVGSLSAQLSEPVEWEERRRPAVYWTEEPEEDSPFAAVALPADRPRLMQGYLCCYATGIFVRRLHRRVRHRLWEWSAPLRRGIRHLWEKTVLSSLRWFRQEREQIRHGFRTAGYLLKRAARRNVLIWLIQLLALPVIALRRHRRLVRGALEGAALVASVVFLLVVLNYWKGTTFALELVYGGEKLGYIADESVLQSALEMAEGRIIKTTGDYVIRRESALTLRPVQQKAVLNETGLCDRILELSGSEVSEMSGLYIDGKFEGAVPDHDRLQGILDGILKSYEPAAKTSNMTVEFTRPVEIVDGLFPAAAQEDYISLQKRLTVKDKSGTPYLGVQIRCVEVYTEPIPYESITVKDSTKYIGYRGIRTEGVEGERRYTADVVYVDGVERYREVLSEVVAKAPVTEVIVVGGYRVNSDAKPGVATGSFTWPLPSCRTVVSNFGYRWGKLHAGIDISGGGVYGKEIIAADGGTVSMINTSGWGGGYGLFVMIDHGNGYVTMYAHCSEVLVEQGQKVTQGEMIAKVGNTGDSYGAHLHFEIREGGVATDPIPYL